MENNNLSMNHYNGRIVREIWPIGLIISFKPKGHIEGKDLKGIIIGHLYVNLLVIRSNDATWHVSTFRCEK